uniref:Wax synthase domain-containing protein n=1 Tax=Mycena chlorophos TaxID=658473 RepID=A0ABQ0MCA9_MYCCL|nr:predicted protein [Mycena chlorophos]
MSTWDRLHRVVDLNSRTRLSFSNFFIVFLPPVLLYYVANALAIQGPKTFVYRLALLPLMLYFAWRATVSLDIAAGLLPNDPDALGYFNQVLALAMYIVSTRTLLRVTAPTPRRSTSNGHLLDALDLTLNLRGIGWNFSKNLKLPPETRPVASRNAFMAYAAKSLLLHILAFDLLYYLAQLLASKPVGSTEGFSIFDTAIANPVLRQLNAMALSLLVGLCIYGAIQIGHDAFALIGIGLFRMPPSDWPPIFNAPWFATSLGDFWASRWHQVFRQEFVGVGARPLRALAGSAGGVFGAFLVSGLLHFVGLWGMNKGADVRVVGFFLMMGLGVVLESAFQQVFKRQRDNGECLHPARL